MLLKPGLHITESTRFRFASLKLTTFVPHSDNFLYSQNDRRNGGQIKMKRGNKNVKSKS